MKSIILITALALTTSINIYAQGNNNPPSGPMLGDGKASIHSGVDIMCKTTAKMEDVEIENIKAGVRTPLKQTYTGGGQFGTELSFEYSALVNGKMNILMDEEGKISGCDDKDKYGKLYGTRKGIVNFTTSQKGTYTINLVPTCKRMVDPVKCDNCRVSVTGTYIFSIVDKTTSGNRILAGPYSIKNDDPKQIPNVVLPKGKYQIVLSCEDMIAEAFQYGKEDNFYYGVNLELEIK